MRHVCANVIPHKHLILNGLKIFFLLAACTSASRASAPTAGLVGYWNFDNGSGTTATDSSGNGNAATLNGGATWVAGKIGASALQLNGSTGYASMRNIPFGGTNPITVCAWMKPDAFNSGRTIFSEASEIVLQMNGTNLQWILNSLSTNDRVSVPSGMTAGNWYHVCGLYSAGTGMQVYINGILHGSVKPTGSYASVSNQIEIGRMGGYKSGYFDGAIDEVRVYNRALSAQEVVDTYNAAGSTLPPAGSLPAISSVSASPSSITPGHSSTLAWSVSGATSLSIDNGVGSQTSLPSGSTSVSPQATTTYTLTANNSSGSATASATVAVTAASDTTAPTVPAQLSASPVSSSQVNLTWAGSSDNVKVSGYHVYRNGSMTGSATTTSYSDAGLNASTPYSYTVCAYDAAGNASGQSASASATTMPSSGGSVPVTVTANSGSIGLYEIYELTFTNTGKYSNPWEDVTITASFQSPSGKTSTVGGFYYDTNTWKLRFAPRETGTYTWNATFATPAGSYGSSGSMKGVASGGSGFVRISASNPYQLYTEGNGQYFYPIGFNDLVNDFYNPATGLSRGQAGFYGDGKLDWCLGIDPTPNGNADSDQYFGAYAQGKNNFFRWNGQGTVPLWATGQVNVNGSGKNVYSIGNGKLADELAMKLHTYKFKYQMTFLADPTLLLPNFAMTNTAKYQSLLSLHRYVINRWGAYVDVWELMNEKNPSTAYLDAITTYVRAHDPYQHPITTSYQPATPHPGIEIVSGHNYYNVSNLQLDQNVAQYIKSLKPNYPNRPMVLGETGNIGPVLNYEPERYRIILWTGLMTEASSVFWNVSYSKTNVGGTYIGNQERAESLAFSNYVAGFDPLARPVSVSAASTVRAYAMGSSQGLAAYIVQVNSHNTKLSGATITVNVPKAGLRGTWTDPATGTVLGTFSPAAGSQTLTVPGFSADIAMRIK